MAEIKTADLFFLMGAGASQNLGVPGSAGMLDGIKGRINTLGKRREYWILYGSAEEFVHDQEMAALSAPSESVAYVRRRHSFNIETLVDVLREESVGAGVVSEEDRNAFLRMVLGEVGSHLEKRIAAPNYFMGFAGLREALGSPIHAFTLNFDLGVEVNDGLCARRGFTKRDGERTWEPEQSSRDSTRTIIDLYKVHGSIDWVEIRPGVLVMVDPPYDIERAALVLGFREKERGAFPFPYWTYRVFFRRLGRFAVQIVVIGYGFADRHINALLREALRDFGLGELLVVGKYGDEDARKREESEIAEILGVDDGRITVINVEAEEFLRGIAKRLRRSPATGRASIASEHPSDRSGETAGPAS